ncbi:Conserved_hypothetical protein [Hexamita inflata]|uniref:Uncharacterized protein n=1 Tax=Hexamita inflata TaxID=28002 RepID=A0AA86VT44_9EUKA|nr:Conserved hypothetical protein [Hexamita inflata]CAI9976971.1 Conserved hypothetical protein [Hexamita inflata]
MRGNRLRKLIDQIFCQFIHQNSVHYYKQKQHPLPVFGINDCNNSTCRQAWLVSTAYKVLFLTIFGQSYEFVNEACKLKGFPASLMDDIRKLYFDILNLWSRHYDYLLMFLQTLTLATVKELIAEFKYRKALELLDSFIKKDENKGNVKVDPSEREKQLQKLFPLPKQTELKLNFRPYQKQFFTFTEKEIFDAICELDTTKACGSCGISNKYMEGHEIQQSFHKKPKGLV